MQRWRSSPWKSYKSSIKSVLICTGVTSIGNYAFEDCSSLTSITIPDSVTSIGNTAFSGCSKLTDIYYFGTPEKWDAISIGSFNHHFINAVRHYASFGSHSAQVTWKLNSGGVLTISGRGYMPDYSSSYTPPWFSSSSSIKKVVIESGVRSIGNYAFYYCSSLTSITIAKSVSSIGSYAFSSCSSLASVIIPDSVTHICSYAFEDCSSLKSITIPHSVTTIENRVFYYCRSLTSISIPRSVTSIGSSAFSYCSSLNSITIPDSVTSIGYAAFSGCSSLTDVYYTGTRDQWNAISIGLSNEYLMAADMVYKASIRR